MMIQPLVEEIVTQNIVKDIIDSGDESVNNLQLENGSNFLLENGDFLLLE